MKIILNQDVVGLGEEGDVREVADGYARNYLIPRKLAVQHTKANLAQLDGRKTAIEGRKEEKRKEAMSLKERLEAEELLFSMPAGESGKLFGSVNNSLIAVELEKKGYALEKRRIEVPEHHLRQVGSYIVKIKLYGNEEASLKVVVEAAKQE
jgi:large subunit ribosomal protein L9